MSRKPASKQFSRKNASSSSGEEGKSALSSSTNKKTRSKSTTSSHSTSQEDDSTAKLRIMKYKNSYLVLGDTKPYKDGLKVLGLKWGTGFEVNGVKTGAWMLYPSLLGKVQDYVDKVNAGTIAGGASSTPTVKKSLPKRNSSSDDEGVEVKEPKLPVPPSSRSASEEDTTIAKDNLRIVKYKNAYLVVGNTRPHKDELKALGLKWGASFDLNGSKTGAWMFYPSLLGKVEEYVVRANANGVDSNVTHIKYSSSDLVAFNEINISYLLAEYHSVEREEAAMVKNKTVQAYRILAETDRLELYLVAIVQTDEFERVFDYTDVDLGEQMYKLGMPLLPGIKPLQAKFIITSHLLFGTVDERLLKLR